MRDASYIVYSYQYREMPRPKIDGFRRIHRDRRDLDSMPCTVIRWINVAADTKREALTIGRPILREGQA